MYKYKNAQLCTPHSKKKGLGVVKLARDVIALRHCVFVTSDYAPNLHQLQTCRNFVSFPVNHLCVHPPCPGVLVSTIFSRLQACAAPLWR